jgi:hypothetical protein
MSSRHHLPARAWIMIILMSVLATSAIVVFAWQTWEFVNWLLPSEQWLIKMLAVANFDIMSLVWILADLFLPLEPNAKVTAAIAGGIDFFFSTVATVLELTVVAAIRFNQDIWPPYIYIAYAVIALTLVVNLVSFILVIRIQWPHIISNENLTPAQPKNEPSGLALPPPPDKLDDLEELNPEAERLQNILDAAHKKGYSMDAIESFLGIQSPASGLANGAKKKTLPKMKP